MNITHQDTVLTAKNDDFVFNVTGQANVSALGEKQKGKSLSLAESVLEVASPLAVISASSLPQKENKVNWGQSQNFINKLQDSVAADNLTLTSLQNEYQYREDTTRAMTEVAQAGVAVAAVAIAAVTAGAGSGVSTAMMTAAATSASTVATNAAIQASMNADGDIFKQIKDVSKDTWDSTSDSDSLRNIAIAAVSAGATSYLTQVSGLQELKTIAENSNNMTGWQRLGVAVADSALANTTSIATQSVFNGDSFSEAMRNQITNIAIAAIANVAAQEIGSAYHNDKITKPTQLTLHAALGCASAAAGGGDCASGAVAGVVGEVVAETYANHATQDKLATDGYITSQELAAIKKDAIALAHVAGGFSAIFTGNAVGLSDSQIAENMAVDARIGQNAGENNFLQHLTGAVVGGVAGAGGAAYSAYVEGKDRSDIIKSAAIGGATGIVFGASFNPQGVIGAMTVGSFTGATGSGFAEYKLNDNASLTSIGNAALEGSIGGAAVSATSFLFTPAGSGIAGRAIGSMTALPIDFTASVISQKYDIIDTGNNN